MTASCVLRLRECHLLVLMLVLSLLETSDERRLLIEVSVMNLVLMEEGSDLEI